jgi:hypothetical protein
VAAGVDRARRGLLVEKPELCNAMLADFFG